MRDQLIRLASDGHIAAGVQAGGRGWLELATPGDPPATVQLGEGELLMAIEAPAMVYADLCGARPESLARGVNRTLRNRTRAARERSREDA